MIPKGLTDDHFAKAAAQVDRHGAPADRHSVHYDLIIGDKKYPPKYIVSLAAKFASGREHPANEFNAVEARDYFRNRGYVVIDRREQAESTVVLEDDESAFPEGRESFRQHRHLERDGKIPRKAKAIRLAETGRLECEVCQMDFHRVYGERGSGFIEAHHTVPVSEIDGAMRTKVRDLALVCSNCHRMLHRGKPLMTIIQLRALIESQANKG